MKASWGTIDGMRAVRQAVWFGVVPLVSLPAPVAAQDGQRQPPGLDREIATLSQQWMRAVWEQDESALNRLMADDFVYSTPNESVKLARRQEWLKTFSGNGGECVISNPHVDAFGDAAILGAEMSCPAGWELLKLRARSVVSDVWVRQGGRWRVTTRVANGIPRFGVWLPLLIGAAVPLLLWGWASVRDRTRQRSNLLSVANRY